ncbi:MAG: LysM peptidoglycan-binding domain-containing protein, partial [Acetivibrio ethanolgignens]
KSSLYSHFSSKEEIITEIKEEGSLLDKLSGLPGLVGYIAGEKESLWDIAKAFNTTLESIMELNELETEAVKPGDKLLLMKQVDSIPLLQETPR